MKGQIKSIVSLFCICAVIALALAFTNELTQPLIKKNELAATNQALLDVLPSGEDFKQIDLSSLDDGIKLPSSLIEAYSEKNGGYVFKLGVTGYAPNMIIMCGINPDGTVSNAVCLESGETLGYQATFGDMFKGKDSAGVDAVATVSGATKTTGAYKSAVKDAINAFINLNGGSAETRTEEEILNDNLLAALGVSDTTFTFTFVAEELDGVDCVYTAANNSGTVYVCGESFVGVNANGDIVTEGVSDELSTLVKAAQAKLAQTSVETTSIDLKKYTSFSLSTVKSAEITQSGNYILTLNAAGYGINGDQYKASGEYIKIKIAITPEGKIICCQTISQNEAAGNGEVCGKPIFYTQFIGKTESNYKDIVTIPNAELTNTGYTKAILRAFEAVKIFEGGN